MWKTILMLIVTIIVVPVLAFLMDEPLNAFQSDVLNLLVVVYLVAAVLCFIVSSLSRNYSQVDKLWSIMPIVYTWIVAYHSGFESRPVWMAVLVSFWGLRLSLNFTRRGGYKWKFWEGEEDYRWPVLRSRPEFAAPWKWMLFNFFFISLYQMGLILLFSLPALKSAGGGPLGWIDFALAAIIVGLVVIETVADQQQWIFHKEKNRLRDNGMDLPEPYNKGFVHTGLWALARHPNYAAEQAIWIVFYFFSVLATGSFLNWSVIGCLLLVLLFKGSSDFSESISAGKYPEYAAYQKSVPRFIPIRFRAATENEEDAVAGKAEA